jgi:hypothetical protein
MNSKDGSAGPIPNKGGLRYEQHTGRQGCTDDTTVSSPALLLQQR